MTAATRSLEWFTRRIFTRIITSLARTLREEDLTVVQVATLYLVDERHTMRIGQVARAINRPVPLVSRMVDDLVQRRFLVREEDPKDRRAKILTLSAKGRAFIERAGQSRVLTIVEATAGIRRTS